MVPIVLPESKRYWDLLILVFVIYNAVLVPYDVGKVGLASKAVDVVSS